MLSLLENVDKHIKEQEIDFKGITMSTKVLPYYVNKALLHRVRKYSNRHFDCGSFVFTLEYDDANKLYLVTSDLKGKTRVVIANGGRGIKVDFPLFKYWEENLILDSLLLKYHRHWIGSISDYYLYNNGNLMKDEMAKIEYDINEEIIEIGREEMVNNPEFNINKIKYKDKMWKSIDIINDYIDYCYLYDYDMSKVKERVRKR